MNGLLSLALSSTRLREASAWQGGGEGILTASEQQNTCATVLPGTYTGPMGGRSDLDKPSVGERLSNWGYSRVGGVVHSSVPA